MTQLSEMKCEVCRVGGPGVTEEETAEFLGQIPDWQLVERDAVKHLERVFKFKNFVEALAFTNAIGDLAEEEGHHPAILTEWGRVTVTLWTHKIGGLSKSDFVMAAKVDEI